MKKSNVFILLFVFSTITLLAQFAGGEGTAFYPYYISTPQHLANIMMQDEDDNYLYLDKYFQLGTDIDMDVAPFNEGEGWLPIGTPEHPFTGNIDGYGWEISNLYINRPAQDNVGLFGYTQEACLFHIKLENVNIVGKDNVGALSGYLEASSVNKKGIGPVWPSNYKCTVSGSIHGQQFVGGLFGFAQYSSGERCYSFADVSGINNIGGIFGWNEVGSYTEPPDFDADTWIIIPGSFFRTYSTGDISGSGNVTGGLVGRNVDASISSSYSTSNIDGVSIVGGLCGLNTGSGTIHDCYTFLGNITGTVGQIGGLIGSNIGTIENCYSNNTFTGSDPSAEGLVGANTGTINNSYWDTETSGISAPGNGEGRTTDEMTFPYDEDTFVDWDFEITWEEDEDIGMGYFKDGYPYLQWERTVIYHEFAGGSGTEEDPYLIATAYQLYNVRDKLDKHFLQIRDIDLDEYPYNDGEGWEPIGTESQPFTGSYNGDGFNISNLFINRAGFGNNYAGLFGYTEGVEGSILHNINLQNANITGHYYTGSLIGHNENTLITNCSVTGTIEAPSYVGGLIGENTTATISSCTAGIVINGSGNYIGGLVGYNENSIISHCHSSGTINSGSVYIGGLVGINITDSTIEESYSSVDVTGSSQSIGGFIGANFTDSEILNCYALGLVTSYTTYTGGFCGYNRGTITNCFSTGNVIAIGNSSGFLGQGDGTESRCYWNTETSDDLSSGTAIGRTTDEMTSPYDEDTYFDWDFTDIWLEDIDYSINNGYPYLKDISYVEAEISEPVIGDILINEVCGDDVHPAFQNDGYIELINIRPYAISLENVIIRYYDNGSEEPTSSLELLRTVEPNEYFVICQDFATYSTTYGPPPADFEAPKDGITSLFPLDGGEDAIEVYLNDAKAGVLDRFNNPDAPWTWDGTLSYERINSSDGGSELTWEPGDGIPGDDDTPLPVTLASFTAHFNNETATISWQTQSETNNKGWNIYRNIKDNFDTAEKINSNLIDGAGTSSQPTDYEFVDVEVMEFNNSEFWYWLESIANDGSTALFGSVNLKIENPDNPDSPQIPIEYGLHQNYPNPFNPTTKISFSLKNDSNVELAIYNLKGQKVRTLIKDNLKANDNMNRCYNYIWDGKDSKNRKVSSGVYLYQLITEQRKETQKMLLLK